MRSNLSFLVLVLLSQFVNEQTPVYGAVFYAALIESATETKPIQFVPYDQSKIINQEQSNTLNYQLALAPYKKRQNRWRPDKAIRLQGHLYRETHELMAGFDEQDVYAFYKSQVPSAAELLFECRRRDCGESNNWANDHFNIKQLYGSDQYQFYSVHQLGDDQYISLYVVRRGNRRVYTQIETLISKP
jgi:hypothetical protein